MNDRLSRAERLIEQLAEQNLQLGEKVAALADSQKHTDSNIEALTEMLRQLIERGGNGRASH